MVVSGSFELKIKEPNTIRVRNFDTGSVCRTGTVAVRHVLIPYERYSFCAGEPSAEDLVRGCQYLQKSLAALTSTRGVYFLRIIHL